MHKQSEITHSQKQSSISTLPKESLALVLRAQPNKETAFTFIAMSLDRLVKLYQIPNWNQDNSNFLAEWIFDNYSCEPLELILNTLKNPPDTGVQNWRLTPDTISKWMSIALEKRSIELEKEHKALKPELSEPISDVDYESFKSRLVGDDVKTLPEPEKQKDQAYNEFRNKYLAGRIKKSLNDNTNNNAGGTE